MKQQQRELIADTHYVHFFRAMLESGEVAALGPHAVVVLLVIKCYANWRTGEARPSIKTIAEQAGVSRAQVNRAISTLKESGYLDSHRDGSGCVYKVKEKISLSTVGAEGEGFATWTYIPQMLKHAVSELRDVMVTQKFDDTKIINFNIENLQLVIGDDNTVAGKQAIIITAEETKRLTKLTRELTGLVKEGRTVPQELQLEIGELIEKHES